MSTLLSIDKVVEPVVLASKLNQVRELKAQAKREILELQGKKESIFKSRKLWFWRPTPKQLKFFEKSTHKRRAGFCGNRFGKSTLGVVEDICWLIGFRPFFPEGHPLRTLGIPKHGVKGLVVAEDWDKVKEIFTNDDSEERKGKFFDFLPEDYIKKKHRNEKGIVDQITVISEVDGIPRESIIYFDTVKSFKMAPASFESSDWDFVHIDEPVMKELWVAVSRGLIDRGGFSWWLFTPIKELWMYDDMVDQSRTNPDLFWWFEATMDDNPTLSEEDKMLYLNSLSPDERDARRRGIPLAHGRLVFSDYQEPVHLFRGNHPKWPSIQKPPHDSHMVVLAIDTHPQTPHAVLFTAVADDGAVDFYDEIFEQCKIEQLCGLIKAKLEGVRVQYVLCEPGAWNEDQGSGFCYADMFFQQGLSVIPGSKRKDAAIMLTQQLFRQRVRPVRVHERCVRLRKELHSNYYDKANRAVDKDDHMLECLRRLVIHDGLAYYPLHMSDKPMMFTNERDFYTTRQNEKSLPDVLGLTTINLNI